MKECCKYKRLTSLYFTFQLVAKIIFQLFSILRKVFFAYSKGKNRALSLAEGLGRLYYCGFEVLDLKEIDDKCFFVAKKVGGKLLDVNPSYSLIFKMKRHGKDGKIIYVYKLRTMHPYSEFLQEFVYKSNSLDIRGKFKDDFRITKWGRIFRKLWIDELPMLYNWLRGDVKIVGVRPLSSHYLSLYDKELHELRKQTKPGLIPPFYLDMPETFEEICASEKKYLQAYLKHPVRTELYYGFWCLFNIFVRNARSG